MYQWRITWPDGTTRVALMSGLTRGEEESARAQYERMGAIITPFYGVWR